MVRKHSRIKVRTLLNIGCGGGHNDRTLKAHFAVTGVDLSKEMLALARRLNPDVEYHLGDMRTLRLHRRFDAVTIFDSIGYMRSLKDLRAAFKTAYVHLKPGGVFLTFAEETKESFRSNRTQSFTGSAKDADVTFVESQYDSDPADTVSETVFLYIIRKGGKFSVETDRHKFGLFSFQTWVDVLKVVGFEVVVIKGQTTSAWGETIPWFVCIKI